jgi:hypothetical protein
MMEFSLITSLISDIARPDPPTNIFLGSTPDNPEVDASKAATASRGAGFHFFMMFS